MSKRVLIVGGVAGGASAAARCRRLDENAEIIMFERGPVVSFSNCCLPYHISGLVEREENLILMTPKAFKDLHKIEARVNSNVLSVNTKAKSIKVKNTVTAEMIEESYDALVIAPGANAIVSPFQGLNKIDNYCLKTVADASAIVKLLNEKKPKHITVVGGGLIGLEAAESLRKKGIEVTIVEAVDQIIPFADREMSYFGQAELVRHGVEVILEEPVAAFDTRKVILKSGRELETDAVILALGVTPATKFLASSDINLTNRGYIIVDGNYQTSAKDVYAVGDAISVINQLTGELAPQTMAGAAKKQGRLVADRINGRNIVNKGYIGSAVVKLFNINIAATGLSEKVLKTTKIEYGVVYAAPPGIVGLMPGAHLVFSKLLFEMGSGRVLGAQFASTGAVDKRADVIATAIKANMTVEDLFDLELSYAPSFGTGKDVVNKIGYIASNLNQKAFKQISFTQISALLNDGQQVIDVREVSQHKAGSINGVINIPMSEMRERLGELDKTRPVYLHCRTGELGYNATLMLQSKGFDAINIAGGYEFVKVYEEVSSYNCSNRKKVMVGAV